MTRFLMNYSKSLLVFALAVATSGCGDTGGDSALADGGIRGTGSSVGPVSGFGSVFVNGTRFEFDGTVVSNDGITSEEQLELGMILRIDGQWQGNGEGAAETVEYDDTLRGPMMVESPWDLATKTAGVSILGRQVRIDSQTVLKGVSTDTLTDGTFVRMSGWRLADGSFRASYLGTVTPGSMAPGEAVEVEGVIARSGLTLNQFELGSLQIRFNATTRFEGVAADELQTGTALEVEGVLAQESGQSYLNATVIRPDDKRRYQTDQQGDIQFSGPVSVDFTESSVLLMVNGLKVKITSDTELDDDLSVTGLRAGTLVQVEGRYDAFGNIVASEIELRDGEAEVEGVVDSGSLDAQIRQLRVGGVLVQVTSGTLVSGDDDDYGRPLGFNDLGGSAVSLEISGIERTGEDDRPYLEALRIEVEEAADSGSEYELVGSLSHIDQLGVSSVTVLGVEIEVVSADAFDDGLSLEVLKAELEQQGPQLLEIEYRSSNTHSGYVAEEIELEERDDD